MAKFILHTTQYENCIIIIADPEKWEGIITDTEEEALVFDSEMDNPETKLSFWRACTGYDLQIKYID